MSDYNTTCSPTDSESSSSCSGEEDSIKLTKSDKALIFDLVLSEEFSKLPSCESAEYRCAHSCHVCDDPANRPSTSNFQQSEHDYSFGSKKRKLIIESVVHDSYKRIWTNQKKRLLEIDMKLKSILKECLSAQTKTSSALETTTGSPGKVKITEVDDRSNQHETSESARTTNTSQNTGVGQSKGVEEQKDRRVLLHSVRDIATMSRCTTLNDGRDVGARIQHDNSKEFQVKMENTLTQRLSFKSSVPVTESGPRQDDIIRLKRRLNMDQDFVPEKKPKIEHVIPLDLRKTQVTTTDLETHQKTMYERYGPLTKMTYHHNSQRTRETVQDRLGVKPEHDITDQGSYKWMVHKRNLRMNQEQEKERRRVELMTARYREEHQASIHESHNQPMYYQYRAALSVRSYPHRPEPVRRSRYPVTDEERPEHHVTSLSTVSRRKVTSTVTNPEMYSVRGLHPRIEIGPIHHQPYCTTPRVSERQKMDSPMLVMNSTNEEFYIDRKYLNVSMYWKGLREEGWNPTQCVYEICASCYWGTPTYTEIDFVLEKGYIYALMIKNHTFLPKRRVIRRKDAKHIASVEFLKYLGFDFDFMPEFCPLNVELYQRVGNYNDKLTSYGYF